MSNNRMVRDSNHKKLAPKKPKSKVPNKVPEGAIAVNHGNAPLLTAKYLELILLELRELTKKLEKVDG